MLTGFKPMAENRRVGLKETPMAKTPQSAISPTRVEDYPEWYQQVVRAAELAEDAADRKALAEEDPDLALLDEE